MHLVCPHGLQWLGNEVLLHSSVMIECILAKCRSSVQVSILHLLQDSSIAIIQMLILLPVHLTHRASCSTNRLQTFTKIGLHISCMNRECPPSGYATVGERHWDTANQETWNKKHMFSSEHWPISLYQYPKPWGKTVCLCHPSASSTLLQTNV